MREFLDFIEFYNYCNSILSSTNKKEINYIRKNYDDFILNSYYCIGKLPEYAVKAIDSQTNLLKFSVDF